MVFGAPRWSIEKRERVRSSLTGSEQEQGKWTKTKCTFLLHATPSRNVQWHHLNFCGNIETTIKKRKKILLVPASA
uniref:Uncharacterized protein n=1 Tax=Setaria viridis TaxID=4556 RepID=A0A4U6VLM9_SETVI|nr:hypothetical protein SEVIR_2G047900v2 [Setaria viridis]